MYIGDKNIVYRIASPFMLICLHGNQVRTSKGQEGYIPALTCVLPTPDKSALTASERYVCLGRPQAAQHAACHVIVS